MESVIVTKRNKAWIGELDGLTVVKGVEVEGTVPPDGYIPLHEFLRLTNPKQTLKQTSEVRKKIGFTQIFVYIEDNDDYWAYTNHKCNTCLKKCKQSSKVEILVCPQYEEDK